MWESAAPRLASLCQLCSIPSSSQTIDRYEEGRQSTGELIVSTFLYFLPTPVNFPVPLSYTRQLSCTSSPYLPTLLYFLPTPSNSSLFSPHTFKFFFISSPYLQSLLYFLPIPANSPVFPPHTCKLSVFLGPLWIAWSESLPICSHIKWFSRLPELNSN